MLLTVFWNVSFSKSVATDYSLPAFKKNWTRHVNERDILCLLEKMKRKISIFSMFIPYPAFHWATSSVSQSFYVLHSCSAPISCLEMRAPISAMAGDRSVWVDRKQSVLKRKIKLKISRVTYWNTPMCCRDDVCSRRQWRRWPSSLWWGGLI